MYYLRVTCTMSGGMVALNSIICLSFGDVSNIFCIWSLKFGVSSSSASSRHRNFSSLTLYIKELNHVVNPFVFFARCLARIKTDRNSIIHTNATDQWFTFKAMLRLYISSNLTFYYAQYFSTNCLYQVHSDKSK